MTDLRLNRRAAGAGLLASLWGAAAWSEESEAVDVRTFGAVGDGIADDTAALARAHASGRRLIYPKTSAYFRISQTLTVQADVEGRGGEIRLKGDGSHHGEILKVTKGNRPLTISGLVLDGEYEGGRAGEWSMGVSCVGASKVTIRDNVIRRPYGDCVYIGSDATRTPCSDISVVGNTLIDPRRCNVAVVSGERIQISNNRIHSKYGYVSAIDLEPDDNGADYVRDVSITGNVFTAAELCISVTRAFRQPTTGVVIKNNTAIGHRFLLVDKTAKMQGGLVTGNRFASTYSGGYFIKNDSGLGLNISNNVEESACGISCTGR